MPVRFQQYSGEKGFSPDFMRVCDFLRRINEEHACSLNFPWGRWEWMFSLERFLETEHLSHIGVWEDKETIVALVTYESVTGEAYFFLDPKYENLKQELLAYAMTALQKEGRFRALIPDSDAHFQKIAAQNGFLPTQNYEPLAVLPLDEPLFAAPLPEGFSLVSLEDEYDLKKYNRVLHRGFNHEGDAPEDEETLKARALELGGPHSELSLKIAVKAPNGEFAAYCGMWHQAGDHFALVEPVATDPTYRRMGLGKAAVLEACRRCAVRGAKNAYVGSSQQFYYNIGFRPLPRETWWEKES